MNVFVSYSSEDRRHAERLVKALKADGIEAWWDRELRPGEIFDGRINAALAKADVVIAIWTKRSIASDWVRAEAHAGFTAQKLRSVLVDDARIPVPFNVVHYTDLSHWYGSRFDGAYLALLQSLGGNRPERPIERRLAVARRALRGAVLVSLPFAVAALGMSDDLERVYLHGPLLTLGPGPVVLHDVAVLPLPAPAEHEGTIELRRQYPALLETLRGRGVREVFFDMTFRHCHPDAHVDRAFAAAIDEAAQAGLVVALGASIIGKATSACPVLAGSKADWVNVDFLRDQGLSYTARFADPEVGVGSTEDPRPLWHASALVGARRRGVKPEIAGNALQLGDRRTTLSGGLLPLSPVQSPSDAELLTWPDPGARARGRVVVVGDVSNDRLLAIGGEKPGPVVHAGLIQAVLGGRVPRDARRGGAAALATVAGGLAVVAGRFTRASRRMTAAFAIMTLFLLVALLAAKAILVSVVPACVAVAIAAFLTPRVARQ